MRFECDSCQTRYSIPDARVVGRVLKIRCKRCSEVVEVMGPPSPNAPGGFEPALRMDSEHITKVERNPELFAVNPELEHRASGVHLPVQISAVRKLKSLGSDQESGVEVAEWWAGVKGSPQGPLRRSELMVLAQRGQLDERSYVWRPSMRAWRRVGEDADLRFVLNAIQDRKKRVQRPRPLSGMESGIFVNTGLFDASLLASALSERTREVDPGREPSGLTHALKSQTSSGHDLHSAARPLQNLAATMPLSATPTRAPTIQLGGSDWFALSEREQVELWSRELPPDLPGTTALVTGVHLLPRRRRLKALASALAIIAVFAAGVLLLAWLTRDGLTSALGAPTRASLSPGQPYQPEQNLVTRIRRLLDPARGKGVRWPGRVDQAPVVQVPSRRSAHRAHTPRVVASARPALSLSDAVRAPATDRFTARRAQAQARTHALQLDSHGRLLAPSRAAPSLSLGSAPVAMAAPSLALSDDLDAMDVARVIAQRRPQLESCYTAALKRDSGLRGSVEVSIVINTRGRVSGLQIPKATPGAKDLASCMRQVMRRWHFAKPSTELEVLMPLRLNPVQ